MFVVNAERCCAGGRQLYQNQHSEQSEALIVEQFINDATIELSIFKKTVQPIPIINPATTDFFKADKYSIPHLVLFLLKL